MKHQACLFSICHESMHPSRSSIARSLHETARNREHYCSPSLSLARSLSLSVSPSLPTYLLTPSLAPSLPCWLDSAQVLAHPFWASRCVSVTASETCSNANINTNTLIIEGVASMPTLPSACSKICLQSKSENTGIHAESKNSAERSSIHSNSTSCSSVLYRGFYRSQFRADDAARRKCGFPHFQATISPQHASWKAPKLIHTHTHTHTHTHAHTHTRWIAIQNEYNLYISRAVSRDDIMKQSSISSLTWYIFEQSTYFLHMLVEKVQWRRKGLSLSLSRTLLLTHSLSHTHTASQSFPFTWGFLKTICT